KHTDELGSKPTPDYPEAPDDEKYYEEQSLALISKLSAEGQYQWLPNLTRVKITPNRDRDLLSFEVDSDWEPLARVAAKWEVLPPPTSLGPFHIRLIAPPEVRKKFFDVATNQLSRIAGDVVEDKTRKRL